MTLVDVGDRAGGCRVFRDLRNNYGSCGIVARFCYDRCGSGFYQPPSMKLHVEGLTFLMSQELELWYSPGC